MEDIIIKSLNSVPECMEVQIDGTKIIMEIESTREEPVFMTGGCRIGEGFPRGSRQIFAGILYVFQENLAKNSEE